MNKERHAILYNEEQLGPYPMEKLRRVDKPTTEYVGKVEQRGEDQSAEVRVARGELGEKARQGAAEFIDKEPIFRAFFDVNMLLSNFEPDPVAEVKSELPEDPRVLTRHIKKLAYFIGADQVGICALPKSALYARDGMGNPMPEVNYKYAIILLVGKQSRDINATYGNEWIDDAISMQAYQRLNCQAAVLTSYIRRMGWPAEVSAVPKYSTLMPQLILEAGLGEGSRMGVIVNPFQGATIKTAAVLTDLPLEVDKPIDFGLQEYCEKCRICADQCVTNAVTYGDKTVYNGYKAWRIKPENCAVGNQTNPFGKVCQRCVKVCPWTRPDSRPEDFANWDGDIKYLHDSVDRQARWLEEHDYVHPDENSKKWWFPLRWDGEKYAETEEWDYGRHYRKLALQRKKRAEAAAQAETEEQK